MKIYVNARFLTQPLSGVQRYAIECSQQIKKTCPEITFVAPANIIHTEIATDLDVKIIGSKTGHYWEQTDLPKFLSSLGSPSLLNLANTAPLRYRNNYTTIHDLAFHYYPGWNSKIFSIWYNILIPRLARKAKHIFTVSKTIKQELIECYKLPASDISVTYNGISQKMLEAGPGINTPKQKIILSVGSFNKRKNHHTLIEAFLQSDIKKEYKLVIVGDRHKVFKEAGFSESQLLNGNIEICEGFNDAELIAMYRRAEVVVSLSLYEGFGIPVLEGLFYGCKLICSDILVYRELYSGNANFCDPLDITAVTQALNDTKNIAAPTNTSLLDRYNYRQSAQTILEVLHAQKK